MVEPTVIEGTGEKTTVEKQINAFTQLRVSNHLKVNLVPSATPYMKVITHDNLQKAFDYTEDDGHLTLFIADTIQVRSGRIEVELGIQELEQLNLVGACELTKDSLLNEDFLNVRISGASHARLPLSVDQLNVDLHGASSIELAGKADFVDIKGTGSSRIKAANMEADKACLLYTSPSPRDS